MIRLDKEIRRQGKVMSYETRYFVSSLDSGVVSAKEIQAYIRGHWEVKNCLHWQKDRYDEDKHVLRLPGVGDAWTLLTSTAVSLGCLLGEGEPTLKEVRECCYTDPIPTARKLGWIP